MRKYLKIILFICLLFFVFGCKANIKNGDSTPPSGNTSVPEVKPGGETVDLSNHPALENRKIIYTVTLGIVSTDPSSAYNELINNLTSYDAFIESEEITAKTYKVKIRVKSENLTQMVNSIQNNGETVNYVKTSQDITNTYSTLEAKLNALQAQHTRILELIAAANNLQEILTLEKQRVEIEAELNEIGFALNNYDSLVEYSTLHLTITKIENISELLPKTQTPSVSIEETNTHSVLVLLSNSSNVSTTMTIKVTQSGTLVKELTKEVYQYSKEDVLIDGLQPGNEYKIEVISKANNFSQSVPQIINIETEKTFIKSVSNVFLASLNALLIFLKFIVYIIIALIPFVVVLTIIFIPLRILYIKKVKNRKRP